MANKNFTETANELIGNLSGLAERLSKTQAQMTELVAAVKTAEKDLQEKEEAARKARIERERMEKLHEMLTSDKDAAVHVGGEDERPAPAASEKETATEQQVQAKPPKAREPEAPKAEQISAKEEQPVKEEKTEPKTEAAMEKKPEIKNEAKP